MSCEKKTHFNNALLTEFEKSVYRVVMRIPLGETRSYSWVAAGVARPKSVRAVGNALHKNPYAPFVPCHRVIACDGSLGGYRQGLKKKSQMLEKEKQYCRLLKERV